MFRKFLGILSFPTNPKDLFRWLVTRLVMSLGIGWVLGLLALFIGSIMLFGFLSGDYKGTGNGTTDNSNGLTLDAATTAENKMLLTHYTEVADSWQTGLTQSQISQVEQQQVDLPGAVLLGIGKMVNNFNPPNANEYYQYLRPQLTWKTFMDVTVTHKEVTVKQGKKTVDKCEVSQVQTPVTMLVTANTWDGTLSNSYKWVTTQTGNGCNTTYIKKIELSASNRSYDWSRVWNLFSNIPAVSDGKTFTIQKTDMNQQTLASLIAAVDYGLSDPYVQQMVSTVLFPGGAAVLNLNGPVSMPSGNVIQNILRFKDYINSAAAMYQIPPVLIAGVMYQESGGREDDGHGGLLISSAGAMGLMQVEPSTAAGMYLNGQLIGGNAEADLANPISNIQIGAMYLSELYHQFGNNPSETESAYNAGPGAEQYALAHGDHVAQNSQTLQYVNNIQNSWVPALTKYFGPETTPSRNSSN